MNIRERLRFSCMVALPGLVIMVMGAVMGSVLGFVSFRSLVVGVAVSVGMAVAILRTKSHIFRFLRSCGAFVAVRIPAAQRPVHGVLSEDLAAMGKRAHYLVMCNLSLFITVGLLLGMGIASYITK